MAALAYLDRVGIEDLSNVESMIWRTGHWHSMKLGIGTVCTGSSNLPTVVFYWQCLLIDLASILAIISYCTCSRKTLHITLIVRKPTNRVSGGERRHSSIPPLQSRMLIDCDDSIIATE